MSKGAGIKAISCSLPKYILPAEEFAKGRKVDRKKLKYLGIEGQAVPDKDESVEYLMAKSIERLFDEFDYSPENVGYLLVATEDVKGKGDNPGNRVISLLKRRGVDLTDVNSNTSMAACNPLPSLIEQGITLSEKKGEDVLVVAGDRSLYEENSPGEETQGMAACSFLIGNEPEVGILDKYSGCKSKFIPDWWRPQENGNLPVFDGITSLLAYLLLTSESQKNFKKKNKISSLIEYVEDGSIVFHRPSEYMVTLGFAQLYAYEKKGLQGEIDKYLLMADNEFDKLFNTEFIEIFSQDSGKALAKYKKFQEDDRFRRVHTIFKEMNQKILKKVKEEEEFKKAYEDLVRPGVKWPNYIGNSYTASVGTCLLSALIEKDLGGEKVVITSFGSGANSTTLSLEILDGYEEYITEIDKEIKRMKPISFEKYLELRS